MDRKELPHAEKSHHNRDLEGLLRKIKRYLSKRPLPSPDDRKKFDHEFALSTSFHGIHNIAQNRSRVRKAIWLSVVLGSVSLVAWQIYSRLVNFFTWPTTTSVEVQYVEKIEFPAVTFCNLNRFQAEAVSKFGIIFFLWDVVSKVLRLQEVSGNITHSPEALDFVTSHQNFSITEFVKNNGFYLNQDTLLDCKFFGKPCGPKEEFTDNPLPGFTDAGIIFVIHSPKKEPQFDGLGWSSPVGMHSRVTIRQLKTVHQEYPWGECKPDIKLKSFTTYNTYSCLKECKAQHIQRLCGCLPFLLPDHIELGGLCTMGTHNSSCPVSCEEIEYPATVSYSTFPSQRALKFLAKKLNQSQEYLSENLVNIEINYSDLNYKITQQQKAVSVPELLADVGGQLGLFCGASLITIIEIIEYLLTNFYWIFIFLLLKILEMIQRSPPPQAV
ncbi:Acid-sensing ion channel 5 [Microtus ochrogaster]|uniref:Acid-sensing ion channel 5 n=1 Tax=Microtus ochrogaster TaxID=79684 RepID=A0A8J6GFH8_MICOH|nr:Acid-sensing ion channel 5 [Microtus ochrogaster]